MVDAAGRTTTEAAPATPLTPGLDAGHSYYPYCSFLNCGEQCFPQLFIYGRSDGNWKCLLLLGTVVPWRVFARKSCSLPRINRLALPGRLSDMLRQATDQSIQAFGRR